MNTPQKIAAISTFVIAVGASSAAFPESTGQYVDDAAITTKVKTALLADSKIKASGIKVQTDHGTVQLSGTVDTKEDESQAVSDANQIDGVKMVKDMLVAKGMQQP